MSAKTYTADDAVEAAADENFYQLLKLESGKKVEEIDYPVYSNLEKTLAKRTHDTSGNYTVTPFNLQLTTAAFCYFNVFICKASKCPANRFY